MNSILQTNKRTGAIKTMPHPHYIGKNLWNVYNSYSQAKANAYEYCKDLLYRLAEDGHVLSYGITSKNCMKFTFCGVYEFAGEKYVLKCTADYDRVYLLEE